MKLKTFIPPLIFCCAFSACLNNEETHQAAEVTFAADTSAGKVIPVLEKPAGHSAQIFALRACFPLQFPKAYILKNKISCLSVSETAWDTKINPYLTVNYDLFFDSTGVLYRIKSSNHDLMTDDITLALIDYVDTTDIKRFQKVVYNSKKQIVEDYFNDYKDAYTYDSAGRLCEHMVVTPPVTKSPFQQTQFSYDSLGYLVKAVIRNGNLNEGFSDNALHTHIICSYSYVKERLTSIHYSFKDGRISYSTDLKLVYDGPILSKITMDNPKEEDHRGVTFRVCREK